jgi:tetratricopeptide (TPR) repeat protein
MSIAKIQPIAGLATAVAVYLLVLADARAESDLMSILSPQTLSCVGNKRAENIQMNECDRRIAPLTEQIRVNPKNYGAFINRGNVYVAAGEYDRAMADFDTVISAGKSTSIHRLLLGSAFYGKGIIFLKTRDNQKALGAFSAAVRVDRTSGEAYRGRAEALLRLGRLHEALIASNQAVWLKPQYAPGYILRARIHGALGRVSAATTDSANAAELFVASGRLVFRDELYPSSVAASCLEEDKQLIQVSIEHGRVVVEPLYMGVKTVVTSWRDSEAIVLRLGKAGCRIGVEIGTRLQENVPGKASHVREDVLSPYIEAPKYVHAFYEKQLTECVNIKLLIKAYWGFVEFEEGEGARDDKRRASSLVREYGGEGCSITVRVSKGN